MIQSQFQAQLSTEEILYLEVINKKIKWLNDETLREKITSIEKKGSEQERLFVAEERRWNGQGHDIYYPTIYKEEGLEYIKHLPFYLTKAH